MLLDSLSFLCIVVARQPFDPNNISARTLYRVPAQAIKKKSKFLSFLIGYKVSWYRVH